MPSGPLWPMIVGPMDHRRLMFFLHKDKCILCLTGLRLSMTKKKYLPDEKMNVP